MLKILCAIPCIALCCVLASSVCAKQPDLAAADWSVKSHDNLATNPPRNDALIALVKGLTSEAGELRVCSSQFADLRHSGTLSLVIATSDGRFCSLSIIDKTASGFELYPVELAHFSNGPKIKDLAGNGNLELIVDTDFTGYLGGTGPCVATWPVIYAWTGTAYADVSRQYKGYYERKLESLKEQIAADSAAAEEEPTPAAVQTPEAVTLAPIPIAGTVATGSSPNSSNGRWAVASNRPREASPSAALAAAIQPDLANADCAEAEAAKIERFLGISRDAGMSDAIKWANSDDPNKREFAADVLEDIGTPDAIEHLRSLSNDSNPEVANVAKISLQTPLGPTSAYTIEREEVKPFTASELPHSQR
jgi:hypothetical protein